jgi:hypothetical protein
LKFKFLIMIILILLLGLLYVSTNKSFQIYDFSLDPPGGIPTPPCDPDETSPPGFPGWCCSTSEPVVCKGPHEDTYSQNCVGAQKTGGPLPIYYNGNWKEIHCNSAGAQAGLSFGVKKSILYQSCDICFEEHCNGQTILKGYRPLIHKWATECACVQTGPFSYSWVLRKSCDETTTQSCVPYSIDCTECGNFDDPMIETEYLTEPITIPIDVDGDGNPDVGSCSISSFPSPPSCPYEDEPGVEGGGKVPDDDINFDPWCENPIIVAA